MSIRIASAPGSWGIEPPVDPRYPAWTRILDEIAIAGFDGSELGPFGYLPGGEALSVALESRGLLMPAGFVMEPLSVVERHGATIATTRDVCSALSRVGASTLVLIDALNPMRSATAGRTQDATRLADADWEQLVLTSRAICAIAAKQGLKVAFHPHAGTYVEFEDEVERLMADLPADEAGICVDTGHATIAGVDPGALLNRHRDRLIHVHLKDVDETVLERCRRTAATFEGAVAAGVFTPLGAGSVDLGGFASALARLDYDGWATIEQDRVLDTIDDALADARSSRQYARTVGF